MKKHNMILASILVAYTVVAHADTAKPQANNNEIDGTREVAYTCQVQVAGKKQAQPITAMYGLKGKDVVVAQLKIGNEITPGMWRDDFVIMNRFVSQDPNTRTVMWTTLPATADNVHQVDGGKFSVAEKSGGQQAIVLDACKIDRAATARLNR